MKNTSTLDQVHKKTSSCEDEISELKNAHQEEICAHQQEISELKNQVAELRSLVTKAKAEHKNVPQSPQAEDTELEIVETMDEYAGASGENEVPTGHSPIEVSEDTTKLAELSSKDIISESKTKLAEYRSLVIRAQAEDKASKDIIISQIKIKQAEILSLARRAKAEDNLSKDIISELKSKIAEILSLVI